MPRLLRQSTLRPKWAKANFAWVIEDFNEVATLANLRKEIYSDDSPFGIHGRHIHSPQFQDSEGEAWSMSLDPSCACSGDSDVVDLETIEITLHTPRRTTPVQGFFTLTCPSSNSWRAINRPAPGCGDKSTLCPGSSVTINTKDVVKDNIFSMRCKLQMYCGMIESVIYLPGEHGDDCVTLRPSDNDKLHIGYTEAEGVPCPADILVAKIPAVRHLFENDKAEEHYVVSVPNTHVLVLKELVEYIKDGWCYTLDHFDGDVLGILPRLLDVGRLLGFKSLVEICMREVAADPDLAESAHSFTLGGEDKICSPSKQ